MCGCLSCATYYGPATQARALTGNLTGDPLVCRQALSLLSHTSQGRFFKINFYVRTVLDLQKKYKDNTVSSHILPTLFPPILTYYITMVPLLKLRNQYQYIGVH